MGMAAVVEASEGIDTPIQFFFGDVLKLLLRPDQLLGHVLSRSRS